MNNTFLKNNLRLIARLDIKGKNLIKGISMEGLRVVGDPCQFAQQYYHEGIDELIYMDSVASLYGRNQLSEIVRNTVKNVFVPITVGGGIRTLDDAKEMFRSGADKVAVNTGAVQNPEVIKQISHNFGSQAMVISIDAKRVLPGKWEVYTDGGREKTGLNVVDWAKHCIALGAGEILLTSVDNDGTGKGFDLDLVRAVCTQVNVPVIASGGMGHVSDLFRVATEGGADAVAMGYALHYKKENIHNLRIAAGDYGLIVRKYEEAKSYHN